MARLRDFFMKMNIWHNDYRRKASGSGSVLSVYFIRILHKNTSLFDDCKTPTIVILNLVNYLGSYGKFYSSHYFRNELTCSPGNYMNIYVLFSRLFDFFRDAIEHSPQASCRENSTNRSGWSQVYG